MFSSTSFKEEENDAQINLKFKIVVLLKIKLSLSQQEAFSYSLVFQHTFEQHKSHNLQFKLDSTLALNCKEIMTPSTQIILRMQDISKKFK